MSKLLLLLNQPANEELVVQQQRSYPLPPRDKTAARDAAWCFEYWFWCVCLFVVSAVGALCSSFFVFPLSTYSRTKTNIETSMRDRNEHPDMSALIDALQSSRQEPNDENVRRAMLFVARCQNLDGKPEVMPRIAKSTSSHSPSESKD